MDKKALTKDRVRTSANTDVVPIDGVGEITVRGLSRAEFLLAQKKYPDDTIRQERYILSRAVLDPAGMTEDDVAEWQDGSGPMEINGVANKINALSGIGKDAAKSDVPTDGDDRPGV